MRKRRATRATRCVEFNESRGIGGKPCAKTPRDSRDSLNLRKEILFGEEFLFLKFYESRESRCVFA